MGSSPIVSTAEAQVTGLLFVRDVSALSAVPTGCPPRTFAGASSRARADTGFFAEALEVLDDVGVPSQPGELAPPKPGVGPGKHLSSHLTVASSARKLSVCLTEEPRTLIGCSVRLRTQTDERSSSA